MAAATSTSVDTLKAELRTLGDRRSDLEAQIAAHSARLEAAGVGMSTPLLDAEVSAWL